MDRDALEVETKKKLVVVREVEVRSVTAALHSFAPRPDLTLVWRAVTMKGVSEQGLCHV